MAKTCWYDEVFFYKPNFGNLVAYKILGNHGRYCVILSLNADVYNNIIFYLACLFIIVWIVVADLQSLLSERRRGQLSYTIYKLYDKIDARLRQVFIIIVIINNITILIILQDLKSVTIIPEAGSSTRTNQQSYNELNHIKTSSSIQPSQNTATTPGSSLTSIHNILSSTDSIHKQEHHHESIIDNILSSNLSSTEPSLLPSMPTDDPESSSFGSFLINFAFIVLFIVVSVFVLIQCSHFAVYIARQAFKNRDSGWERIFRSILEVQLSSNIL